LENNTILSEGVYVLELNASDGVFHNISIISITVGIAPQWDPMPEDQTIELGEALSYDVDATDLQTVLYSVNNTDFIIDSNGLLENNTILSVGVYILELYASDGILYNISIISITVDIAPQWDPLPEDQTIELGEALSYDLNAIDLQTVLYSVNNTDFTIDSNGLLENNTILSVGVYVLKLNASDGVFHNISIISITVNIAPQWDPLPEDQTIELGEALSYDVDATDLQTVLYSVNNTDFTIDSNGLLESATALSLGVYVLELSASDGTKNNITIITITVRDTTAPAWNPIPEDQTIVLGEALSYDVDATDLQTVLYSVNNSDFSIDSNGLLTSGTTLSLGVYILELDASDGTNHNRIIITITVVDDDDDDGNGDNGDAPPGGISFGFYFVPIMSFAVIALILFKKRTFSRELK